MNIVKEKGLDRTFLKIGFVLLIVLTLLFKMSFFDYQYGDYTAFLSIWLKEIHEGGGFVALKDPFYNYTPLYPYILVLIDALGNIFPVNNLYAIKIVSILFEYILAFFVGRLAYLYTKKEVSLTTFGSQAKLARFSGILRDEQRGKVIFIKENNNIRSCGSW